MPLNQNVKQDPAGAALSALVPVFLVLVLAYMLADRIVHPPAVEHAEEHHLEDPPDTWIKQAGPGDVFRVNGLRVAYWGRPDVEYADKATRAAQPFVGVVIHYTARRPVLNFVRYQHNGDQRRGGHFGYHFYVSRAGDTIQGAPMSQRTNHIKRSGHRQRTSIERKWSSANTIGISMVGACEPISQAITSRCKAEQLTPEQLEAGLAIARAVQQRYSLPCNAIRGHGELQHDRANDEGLTIATAIRASCGP